MLNLKSQVFEPKDGLVNQHSVTFTKSWTGGGVFGVIHLKDGKIDLEKVGQYLAQSILDLVMNSVEDDRIKLLEGILNQVEGSCQTVFVSEDSLYDNINSLRISNYKKSPSEKNPQLN